MKIAILILCHKNPKQINLLLDKLNHQDIDCYIHIDKKADFANKITKRSNIVLLPDEQRVSVEWAQICLLYTSPSPRDRTRSRMPSSA